ncbi:hypothetical protein C8J56DRAFT_1059171 [Mycena floridula]|nr:hypothetical protein C8J56DRAFT_1059171 [Mycena floridula]
MPAHSAAETEFLDEISVKDMRSYRNWKYGAGYISANAAKFLNHDWVEDVAELARCGTASFFSTALSSFCHHQERRFGFLSELVSFKSMNMNPSKFSRIQMTSNAGNWLRQHPGMQYIIAPNDIEMLENADNQNAAGAGNNELEIFGHGTSASEGEFRPSNAAPNAIIDALQAENQPVASTLHTVNNNVKLVFDVGAFVEPSDIIWHDSPGVVSHVLRGHVQVTKENSVERVDLLKRPALFYPIFPPDRKPAAYLLDLTGSEYEFFDPKTRLPRAVDWIIKAFDQESWGVSTGRADHQPEVTFVHKGLEIPCYRARLICKGTSHCRLIDPELIDVSRTDIDVTSRNVILAAQRKSSLEEGNTIEKRTAVLGMFQSEGPRYSIHPALL